MTNYEYLKSLDYDEWFELLFLQIRCSYCPAIKNCRTNSLSCRKNLKLWLDEEQKND